MLLAQQLPFVRIPEAGGAGATIDVQLTNATDFVSDPLDASVELRFKTDGTVTIDLSGSAPTVAYSWATGTFTPGDYEIKFETSGGSTSSGDATDVWHSLGSARQITLVRTTPGNKTWSGTVRVRLAASPFTELDSDTVALAAEVDV